MANQKKKGGFMAWYESYQGKKVVGMVYSLGASVVIIGALFKIMHFPGAGPMLMIGMGVEALLFAIGCLDKPHAEFAWHNVFPQLVEEAGAEPNFYKELQNLPKPNLAAVTGGAAPAADSSVPALSDKELDALKGGINDLAKTATQLSELGKLATSTTKLGEKLEVASEAAEKFAASQNGVVEATASLNSATASLGNAAATLGNAYASATSEMQNVVNGTKALQQNVETAGQKLSSLNSIYELQINAAQAEADALKAQAQKVSALSADVEKLQAQQAEAVKNGEAYLAATKKLSEQVADLNKVYGNMLNALA